MAHAHGVVVVGAGPSGLVLAAEFALAGVCRGRTVLREATFGNSEFRAFKLDVLRVAAASIAEITTFGPALFPRFGLPAIIGQADS